MIQKKEPVLKMNGLFCFLFLAPRALGKLNGVTLDEMSFSCFYISNSAIRIWKALCAIRVVGKVRLGGMVLIFRFRNPCLRRSACPPHKALAGGASRRQAKSAISFGM